MGKQAEVWRCIVFVYRPSSYQQSFYVLPFHLCQNSFMSKRIRLQPKGPHPYYLPVSRHRDCLLSFRSDGNQIYLNRVRIQSDILYSACRIIRGRKTRQNWPIGQGWLIIIWWSWFFLLVEFPDEYVSGRKRHSNWSGPITAKTYFERKISFKLSSSLSAL